MISSPTMQALPTALCVALLSMALAGPFAAAAEPPGTQQQAGNSQTSHVRLSAQELSSGRSVRLHAPGATYMKVHLAAFHLPDGVALEVADPARMDVRRYAGAALGAHTVDSTRGEDGVSSFGVMSVEGDTVDLRLIGSATTPWQPQDGVMVHDVETSGDQIQPAAICGAKDSRPAACYEQSDPVAYQDSHAVARLMPSGCTAWRVHVPGGAEDRMLTNYHCMRSQADAAAAEVWFNYESLDCAGAVDARVVKVPVAQLLKTESDLDYSLFTIQQPEQVAAFGALELQTMAPTVGTEVFIAGHPNWRRKELSVVSDQDGGYCRVTGVPGTWVRYSCDTEGGNSGSPVIERATGRVLALHNSAGTQCVNQGHSFESIEPRIRELLR